VIQSASVWRALAVSLAAHAVIGGIAWWLFDPDKKHEVDVVDIELAPPPPPVEALPPEVARVPEQDQANQHDETEPASTTPPPEEEGITGDAGVVDAPPDAPPDAKPDAPIDAAPLVASAEAGVDAEAVAMFDDAGTPVAAEADAGAGDATQVALGDAGTTGDATQVAMGGSGSDGSGAGSGAGGSGSGSGALAIEAGSGSGSAGPADEQAVDGAPTTAGTAANLLAYFPTGHTVTALIRFDRLRGTEWATQTERLLRPMPDYRILFGPRDAKIYDKLDTLVISTPKPRDATATTLVAHTHLTRAALRDLLGATTAVAWSSAKGGMLGKRTGRLFPGDKRVVLSPFKSWFLLAPPDDLKGLTAPGPGNIDAIEANAKLLPPWLAGIRKIEAESGDKRGPALVVTLALGGKRYELGDNDFGLGVKALPTPDRLSLAMEIVKQGWLVRGNMRFANDSQAIEFIAAVKTAQQRIADSSVLQLAIGKAVARVIANLSFARTGPRVSYTTSISIADTRSLMIVAAQQLDAFYGGAP